MHLQFMNETLNIGFLDGFFFNFSLVFVQLLLCPIAKFIGVQCGGRFLFHAYDPFGDMVANYWLLFLFFFSASSFLDTVISEKVMTTPSIIFSSVR